MRKIVALFLIIFVLTGSVVSFAGVNNYDATNDAVSDWSVYKSVQGLDSTLPYKTSKGQFNKELWEEQHVVVYGDYTLVPNNDFKTVTGGYYKLNGIAGEYRFHGYDASGGYHANSNFPEDQIATSKLESRKYVYEPWTAGSIGNRLYKMYVNAISKIPDANAKAINGNTTIAKWINEGLSFDIKSITGTNLSNPSLDPVHYLAVQTEPTSVSSGQGTLIHIDKTGNDWYFTVPISPIADKKITPVEALIPSSSMKVIGVANNGDVTLEIKVTGELKDSTYYNDYELKSTYYTRYDIKKDGWAFKLYDNITKTTLTAKGIKSSANTGYALFTVKIPQTQYKAILKSNNSFDVAFTGTSTVDFYSVGSQRKYSTDDVLATKNVVGSKMEVHEDPTPPLDPELPEPPVPILFDVTAPKEILDVWSFNLRVTEIDVSKAVDKYVTINGTRLNATDEASFLGGTYKFPDLDEDRAYDYSITYVHQDGTLYFYQSYVIVYDAVPRATVRIDDPGKVNRKITMTADKSVTSDFLEANSTITVTSSATSEDGQQVYFGSNTATLKEWLIKTPGTVDVNVTVSNQYGSRSYTHQVYSGEDYKADLIAIIWNSNLSRLDKLDMFAEATSLDGDTVGSVTYEIFYDDDNDGTPEKSVKSGTWTGSTDYQPSKLGAYKVVYNVQEEFGQPTLSQYITDADKKKTTVERIFFVENLIPMTKVYSDIEYNFPSLDVAFLVDQDMPRTENDYFKNHQVDISNNFRVNSMMANVDIWDLYTYVFSQTAYDRVHSGGSYPPTTSSYNNNGYTGTLSRTTVTNYPYQVDNGSYQTRTLSKSVTMGKSGWGVSSSGTTNNADGGYTSWTNYWASYSYSDGEGYSGSTSGSGYSYTTYNKKGQVVSSGSTNSPTASGTAYKTETYWQSNYVNYDDYYGDYSGTVTKNVKQAYSPSYQVNSNKYIVYVAKDGIKNVSDFNYVKNIARDATIILIASSSSLKSQVGADYYIPYSTNTQSLIDQVIAITKTENPIVNELAILVNESFTLSNTDIDAEGDPIVETGYQYVHDANYFDNSLGQETGTYATYSSTQYSSTLKTSFTMPGKYTIFRRIKDAPVGFTSQGGYSNLGSLEVVVHRKPIANAILDWDFDGTLGVYKTSWVDKSYDPDFQYSDANKGIVDRKIKYKLTTDTSWTYEIPDNLVPGSYNLEYVVMDKHGIWSDPYTLNFTLASAPEVQLNASLKTVKSQFTTASIPASESVELYNVWTRYPYNVRLEVALYNSTGMSRIGAITNVSYTAGVTGTKTANDINWNNITYQIPSTVTDGNYVMKITAISVANSLYTKAMDFPITVYTPINLTSPFTKLAGGEPNIITATTSIYATAVNLELFRGTARATTMPMTMKTNDGTTKTWEVTYTAPSSATLAEGNYQARFTATVPSGKSEILDKSFELQHLRITSMNIWGEWNHWRGQVDLFGKTLLNMPHRFMSYEKVHIDVVVEGNPDFVDVRFSPELEAMTYVNSQGITYRYVDHIGYTVTFPLKLTSSNNRNFTIEYILPMAKSTMNDSDQRLLPSYWVEVTAHKGVMTNKMKISDIDITGNITNQIYTQPE